MIKGVAILCEVESAAGNTFFGACENRVFFVVATDTCDGFDGRWSFDFEKGFGKVTNEEVVIFNKDETFDLKMV